MRTGAFTRAAGTAGLGALALPSAVPDAPGVVASQGLGPVGNAAVALALFVGMFVAIQGWRTRQARRSERSADERTGAGRR